MPAETNPEFFRRALTGLRSQHRFTSRVRPEDRIDPEGTGVARVRGWIAHPSRAGTFAYAGLCALAFGSVLAMFNPPAVHRDTGRSINTAGYAVGATGAGLLAAAEAKRRRHRSEVVVELHAAGSAATPESIDALRRENQGTRLWLVSQRPIAADVLTAAARADVDCYVDSPREFQQVKTSRGRETDAEVAS